jgi:WD40 repeat protein
LKNEGTLIIDEEKMIQTSLILDLTTLIELKNGCFASADGSKIFIWKDKKLISSLIGHTKAVRSLIQLSSGIIVSSSYDKSIKFWNEKGSMLQNN